MKIEKGLIFETDFVLNKEAVDDGPTAAFRAVRMNGKRAPKVILSNDGRIVLGRPCRVKVERVHLPDVEGKGFIEVSFLGLVEFKLDDSVYVDPVLLKQLESLLCSGRSVLLDGPQGSGKTTLCKALAESLGMKYVFFNCAPCYEPTDFLASLQVVPAQGGGTRTEWLPNDILLALREAGGNPVQRYLVFLDEFNRCRPFALNGIMSAIDVSRKMHDPTQNRYVPIPDNVQWIAAINNGKQFFGTHKIDVAQMDRFAVLKITYPPEEKETAILRDRYPTLDESLIARLVAVAGAIRRDDDILTDLSMRATDEACLILSYPTYQRNLKTEDLAQVLRTSFCNRLPGDAADQTTEAGLAWGHVERVLLGLAREANAGGAADRAA